MSTPSPSTLLPSAAEDLRARPQATPITSYIGKMRSPRNLLFDALVIASFFLFQIPRVLFHSAGDDHYSNYSYTLVIPFVSVALGFFERRKIFIGVRYCIGAGVVLLLTAVMLNLF